MPHAPAASFLDDLDESSLALLSGALERVFVPARSVLFREEDSPEALFIVEHGRLRAVREDVHGRHVIGEVSRGETVGELSLLTGSPARATVIAARDTWVWRLPKASFDSLCARSAPIALAIARHVARRARSGSARRVVQPSTITIVPCGVKVGKIDRFAGQLRDALGAQAPLVIDRRFVEQMFDATVPVSTGIDGQSIVERRLDELQGRHSLILYVADGEPTDWTRTCIERADHLLRVVDSSNPALTTIEAALAPNGRFSSSAEEDLVRLRADGNPQNTAAFLALRSIDAHHHVREGVAADVARVARRVYGHPVGVALSGGGTRGLAHLGLFRALAEAGVTVDAVAGSSIGSFIGAQIAQGDRTEQIVERVEEMVHGGAWDFTLPMVSLLTAFRYRKLMRRTFGEVQIEDLPMPCYLVSSDLVTAEAVVHDEGALWLAARASGSPPILVPPVRVGERLLVDGGVLNNLPSDVVRDRAPRAVVIASDVSSPDTSQWANFSEDAMSGWRVLLHRLLHKPVPPSIGEVILRAMTLASTRHLTVIGAGQADLQFRPDIDTIGSFERRNLGRIVEAGYESAKPLVERWIADGKLGTG